MSEGEGVAPIVKVIEMHEDFIEHVEYGSTRIRILSVTSVVVAAFLVVSYAYQLVVAPFVLGMQSVTVNLVDPLLIGIEIFLTALAALWLVLGITEYRFTSRMFRAIKEIRAAERELEKRITGGTSDEHL